MKVRINKVLGYVKGQVIIIDDIAGVPVSQFWRRRLKDAALDNCVEVVASKQTKTKRLEK